MHGKLSGPAGRAPGAAGEWEAPETKEESVSSAQSEQKLSWGPAA